MNRGRSLLLMAIAFVVAFDLAWLWQRENGAFASELGGHPDEAAHYVTGLMFHDYLVQDFPANPMRFAEKYYQHYPKIGLGMWPPGFYLLQTAWELAFGESRNSLLLLMTTLAAFLSVQVYRHLREEFGDFLAALGGLLLLCQPLVVEHYSMLMAEVLSSILILAGAAAWGRFLETEKAKYALWFGFLAGVATMVKGSGLALAIQAPLAMAFMGSWHLLKRPAVWGGALLTATIAGPWTYAFRKIGPGVGGWLEPHPSWHFTSAAVPLYLGKFFTTFGVVLVLLCLVGIVAKCCQPGSRKTFWAAMGALLIATPVFQMILPVGLEARHLIPSFAPAVMFVVAGLDFLRRQSPGGAEASGQVREIASAGASLVLVVVGVVVAHWQARTDPKKWSGFAALAEAVLQDPALTNSQILISSDGRGEGMFISELCMREKRPGHIVRRASKDLANMDWEGRGVQLKYRSEDDVIEWLNGEGKNIGAVIVDSSMPEAKRGAHHDQVIHLCENHPELFWLVTTSPAVREGVTSEHPIRLYQVHRRAN